MTQFATLWFWNAGRLDDHWDRIESFSTEEHPKPSTVHGGERPSEAPAFSWTGLDADGNLLVGHVTDHLPDTPAIWWVLRHEPNPLGDTVSLIGFADDDLADGTVLPVAKAVELGVARGKEQACAIRWGKGDPKLEQIHVRESLRRKRLSVKMIHVADVVNESAGWGGYIYGGMELTPDGEKLAGAWQHSPRLRPKTTDHTPLERG